MIKYYNDSLREILTKIYKFDTTEGTVMSIEVTKSGRPMTIEISDADGEHEPKSITIDKQTARRLAQDLELFSKLM